MKFGHVFWSTRFLAFGIFLVLLFGLEALFHYIAFGGNFFEAVSWTVLSAFVAIGAAYGVMAIWAAGVWSIPNSIGLGVLVSAGTLDVLLNLFPPPYPLAEIGIDICLVTVALVGGWLLAGVVEHLRRALPVCVIISLVDAWSVLAPGGVTKQLAESFEKGESRFLGALLYSFPAAGGPGARIGIGVTDLLFASAFMVLVSRAAKPVVHSAVAMLFASIVALFAGMFLGRPVPVLPFLAVAFVAVNWSDMKLRKRELAQLAGFSAALVVFLALLSWLRTQLA